MDAPSFEKFSQALLADLRGEKLYRSGHVGRLVMSNSIDDEIDDALEQIGMVPAEISGKERHRTRQIMRMENVADPIDAYEKAVCEMLQQKVEVGEITEFTIKIPGWDDIKRQIDTRAHFIGTPEMHRGRAEQLRETGGREDAEKLEKLALMIDRRDAALRRAEGE